MCNITPSDIDITNFLKNRYKNTKAEGLAIILVGGPGSGKSNAKIECLKLLQKTIDDFVNIDPDEILTSLFKNTLSCYDKVSVINNQSFDYAIDNNLNIVFDGTGKNFEYYVNNVLSRLKQKSYTLHLVIVINNINIVKSRIRDRASNTGRNVNDKYLTDTYELLNQAIPKYISLDCMHADNIYIYI